MGNAINQARLRAGLTQTQLAHAIGTSERNIRRWEAGTAPRAGALAKIAEATGTTVDHLIGGSDSDEDEESDLQSVAADLLAVVRRIVREEVRTAA